MNSMVFGLLSWLVALPRTRKSKPTLRQPWEPGFEEYGEERIQALGKTGGVFYFVVYTWRGETRHIITAWKVGEDGKRRYEALFAQRLSRDECEGEVRATPADAPEIELDKAFWDKARIVETRPRRKASVHLRLDSDTLAFTALPVGAISPAWRIFSRPMPRQRRDRSDNAQRSARLRKPRRRGCLLSLPLARGVH
jgi:hypothetical protein